MFKRQKKAPAEPAKARNPYLSAKGEWADRYADLGAQIQRWQGAFFGLLLVTALVVYGYVSIRNDQQILAYVVTVSSSGQVEGVKRMDANAPPNEASIRGELETWITGARTVYVDANAINSIVNKTYARTLPGSAAHTMLSQYHRADPPTVRAARETVEMSLGSILPISDKTWRVEWTETVRQRSGKVLTTKAMVAVITVMYAKPKDLDAFMANPQGVYVSNFSWTERGQ